MEEGLKPWKYITVFVLSIATDFICAWSTYAVSHRQLLAAATAGFLIPFINLFSVVWFIDEKSFMGRLKLAATLALANSIGSVLMLTTITR